MSVVSSAYMRLLIFLLEILIPAYASSSLALTDTHYYIQVGLKVNIQKMKIIASSLSSSRQTDGKTMKTVRDFILESPKSLKMVTAAMKFKDIYSLEEKL